jgi:hypothetical protein
MYLSRLADGCQWEASRREIVSVLKHRAWGEALWNLPIRASLLAGQCGG